MTRKVLQIKGRPIEVALYRWPSTEVRVWLERASPIDQENRLITTMQAALYKKLAKLAKWKQDHNAFSILILESIDIALASGNAIANALFEVIQEFHNKPDLVNIVQTHEDNCEIWESMQPFSFKNFLFMGDFRLTPLV